MKSILFNLILFISGISITSCELNPPKPPCNPIEAISHLDYNDAYYVETSHGILQKAIPSDFRYFFKTFLVEKGEDIMLTNVRNNSICFDVKIRVDNWDKLGGMKKVNGKSYPKELVNLEWKLINENSKTIVKYVNMDPIID